MTIKKKQASLGAALFAVFGCTLKPGTESTQKAVLLQPEGAALERHMLHFHPMSGVQNEGNQAYCPYYIRFADFAKDGLQFSEPASAYEVIECALEYKLKKLTNQNMSTLCAEAVKDTGALWNIETVRNTVTVANTTPFTLPQLQKFIETKLEEIERNNFTEVLGVPQKESFAKFYEFAKLGINGLRAKMATRGQQALGWIESKVEAGGASSEFINKLEQEFERVKSSSANEAIEAINTLHQIYKFNRVLALLAAETNLAEQRKVDFTPVHRSEIFEELGETIELFQSENSRKPSIFARNLCPNLSDNQSSAKGWAAILNEVKVWNKNSK